MKESIFQSQLIKQIKKILPGCIIIKTDPNYIQGIPDLLILYNNTWAALEVKISETAHKQPNQEFYISKMNNMGFAAFINPNNKEDILHELERSLSNTK